MTDVCVPEGVGMAKAGKRSHWTVDVIALRGLG